MTVLYETPPSLGSKYLFIFYLHIFLILSVQPIVQRRPYTRVANCVSQEPTENLVS